MALTEKDKIFLNNISIIIGERFRDKEFIALYILIGLMIISGIIHLCVGEVVEFLFSCMVLVCLLTILVTEKLDYKLLTLIKKLWEELNGGARELNNKAPALDQEIENDREV
jgi:hypothetical protein